MSCKSSYLFLKLLVLSNKWTCRDSALEKGFIAPVTVNQKIHFPFKKGIQFTTEVLKLLDIKDNTLKKEAKTVMKFGTHSFIGLLSAKE